MIDSVAILEELLAEVKYRYEDVESRNDIVFKRLLTLIWQMREMYESDKQKVIDDALEMPFLDGLWSIRAKLNVGLNDAKDFYQSRKNAREEVLADALKMPRGDAIRSIREKLGIPLKDAMDLYESRKRAQENDPVRTSGNV